MPGPEGDFLVSDTTYDKEDERNEIGSVESDGSKASDGVESCGGGDVDESEEEETDCCEEDSANGDGAVGIDLTGSKQVYTS